MNLSRYTLHNMNPEALGLPDESLFELPEKVLQFGTGTLLRSGPDFWIDRANRQGTFNGRIVVVEENAGTAALFEKQDCLYTVQQLGSEDYSINAAISRVLPVKEEWQQVLDCAHNPEMKLVLAGMTGDTTRLPKDDVRLHPPKTFPGQLLAFLHERFRAFGGSAQSGLLILPVENLAENGKKLEAVVFELAHLNGLEDSFIEWLERCNQFSNSDLDGSVVNGEGKATQQLLTEQFGYTDPLLVVANNARTWTIEGDESVKKIVSFASAGGGVRIVSAAASHGAFNLQEP